MVESVNTYQVHGVGRPAVSAGPLETSARRWVGDGIVRTTLRMWALRAGYLLGQHHKFIAAKPHHVIAVAPDSTRVATVAFDEVPQVWDLEGRVLARLVAMRRRIARRCGSTGGCS